jgi:guanylate kinase
MTARLFVISAPSGAGKTSLVKALAEQDDSVRISVSSTTRKPRPGEAAGEDYVFVDATTFREQVAAGGFLEHAEVFGNLYGTHRDQVDGLLADGCNVILEIDQQGAAQVRGARPDAVTVFILPPSRAELERRLRGRGSDDEAEIQRRLAEAREEISHWAEFQHLIVNDDFDRALRDLAALVAGDTGPGLSPEARAVAESLSA